MVAVDVGNSAVKLCVRKSRCDHGRDDFERLETHTIGFGQPRWHHVAITWAGEQARSTEDPSGRVGWWIASVHREAADQLSRAIVSKDGTAKIRLIRSADVPIIAEVDHPDRVGVDRLLGAFAAINRAKSAVTVVDAGSAITVDWVCGDGRFHGGAIMPGLGLQARALATGTDALPKIEWPRVEKDSDDAVVVPAPLRPARNTVDAIRLGVLTGAAAGIDRLVTNYTLDRGQSQKPRLILTGGDAEIISPFLQHDHLRLSNLACRGLLDMAEIEHKRNGGSIG